MKTGLLSRSPPWLWEPVVAYKVRNQLSLWIGMALLQDATCPALFRLKKNSTERRREESALQSQQTTKFFRTSFSVRRFAELVVEILSLLRPELVKMVTAQPVTLLAPKIRRQTTRFAFQLLPHVTNAQSPPCSLLTPAKLVSTLPTTSKALAQSAGNI